MRIRKLLFKYIPELISGCLLVFLWITPAWAQPQSFSVEEIEQGGKEFLIHSLRWEASRLDIKVKYEGRPLRLPAGNRSLDCSLPGGRKRIGRVQFICFVKVNGQIRKRIRLYGDIKLAQDVFQTTRTLKRGHIIQPGDVRWVRVQAGRILRNTVSNEKELIGHRLIRGLNEGEEILSHMIRKVPLVKHGDRILLVAQKGALRVTVPGVVKQDGFKNDTVRVENLQSRKIVLGTVIDSRTVEIKF